MKCITFIVGKIRKVFALFILLLFSISVCSQELHVKSFGIAENDLTAQTQPRKDLNDKNCALVKVQFVGELANVEGNVIMPLVKHLNETWCYMPQNSRQIKVITKNFLPLMVTFANFGVEKLESNRTYVLVLNQNGNTVQQAEFIAQSNSQQKPTSPNLSSNASGSTITIPVKDSISIEMVKVEAGTFMMGATPEMKNPESDEKPAHQVSLTKDYYLGKYEVTQALWQAVTGNNPSRFKNENLPVERVSWDDCIAFIAKLNAMTGRKFRLPTEAEWEYAARGGKKSCRFQYSGGENLTEYAWFDKNSEGKTHVVGTKLPNELGIFDMSGNVLEWCQDWHQEWSNSRAFSSSVQTNPVCSIGKNGHVIRGGCWATNANYCRSSYRNIFLYSDGKNGRNSWVGFRLTLTE